MIRAHKIRLNPTPDQEIYLRKACGVARFTYNWALAEWKRNKEAGGASLGPMGLKKQFNAIKREQFAWALDVTKSASDTGFFRLQDALKNYYDSKKGERAGAKMGFPKFKSKKRSKLSFSLAYDQVSERNYVGHEFRLHPTKLGEPINMAEPLRFTGKVKETTISYSGGHWWATVVVETEQPAPLQFARESVGVDLGLKTHAVLSDGTEFENQKFRAKSLTKLRRLGRQLSRRSLLYKLRQEHPEATQQQLLSMYGTASRRAKEEGCHVESKRWLRSKQKLERFHAHLANQRSNAVHTMTKRIATGYKTIFVEDLNVAGMMRNRRLAGGLLDASFGEILRQLKYKSTWHGGETIKVGRFFASSKTCGDCGCINHELTLRDRTWTCAGCGVVHDRDFNASCNIEAEGLRLIGA